MAQNSQINQIYQPILDRDKFEILMFTLADHLLRRLQTELDELRKNHIALKEQNVRAVQLGIGVEHTFKPLADELRTRQEQTTGGAARKGPQGPQQEEAGPGREQ